MIKNFWKAFESVARHYKWKLINSEIRTARDKMCPITALCKRKLGITYHTNNAGDAAGLLNIPYVDTDNILEAADSNDNMSSNKVRKLRKKLLELTGLQ